MKRFYFSYLNGLYQILRKINDVEIYVVLIIMFFLCFTLIIVFKILLNIYIPSIIFSKWIDRVLFGGIFYLITKYILMVDEKYYEKYEPMPKIPTLIITFGYTLIIILCFWYRDFLKQL